MIPAKITSLNPTQVTYEKLEMMFVPPDHEEWVTIKVIADVGNANKYKTVLGIIYTVILDRKHRNLELNQSCFIEPIGEGKVKIIKL